MGKTNVTEEEYREAYLKWKQTHQNENITSRITVELDGKVVKLGTRIGNMRKIYKAMQEGRKIGRSQDLTEEQINWWTEQGVELGAQLMLEEEYREAYLKWKEENPNREIGTKTILEINGKTINLGTRISTMRSIYKAMQTGKESRDGSKYLTDEQLTWWTTHGLNLNSKTYNISEEEYREAYLKWKEENPHEVVRRDAKIELNGKTINLGNRISRMRQIYKLMQEGEDLVNYTPLIEEQIIWWTENGIDLGNQLTTEEEYREAYLKWKKNYPNESIKLNTEIELNGKTIKLGNKVDYIRRAYKKIQTKRKNGVENVLLEENFSWWIANGIELDIKLRTEKEYREAYLKWKEEHPNETLKSNTTIEVNGKTIALGSRITVMRQIYKSMQEGKKFGSHKDLTEEQINWWTENGMDLNSQNITEEEYREAYLKWKQTHQDENITSRTTVELDGKTINLGNRIHRMRKIYKAMQEGKKSSVGAVLTEEQIKWWTKNGLILDLEESKENEYRDAYLRFKEEYPNENIKSNTKIELNGKIINLGTRISNMRKIHKAMQEGRKAGTSQDLTEEQISWWTEHGLIWEPRKWMNEQKEKKRLEKIEQEKSTYTQSKDRQISTESTSERKVSTLEKYTEIFQGNEKKAKHVIECLDDLRKRRRSKKKEEYNIDNILKEFDVDLETLEKYLSRARTKEILPRSETFIYNGETLRKFCIDNGYNYEVVSRAIKLHQFCEHDSLEQLINRSLTTYQKKGQQEPATWIYEKYGHLVKHVLLELNLDASSILNHMSNYTVSLEEAIRHNVFLRTREKREHDWLEELYNYLVEEVDSSKEEGQTIDDIVNKYQYLVEEYQLDFEEHQILSTAFFRYLNTIKEYSILDVGLENNQVKKLQKIKDYGLEELDIEESFFVPLKFDKGVLLGRKSELYKRRQLLRQYIIDWDYYSDLEKEQIKLQNNFTSEEILFIEKIRNQINETVSKSL